MRKLLIAVAATVVIASIALLVHGGAPQTSADGPQYNEKGELLRPVNYRDWMYLTSQLGMSYGPAASGDNMPPMFTNVFVNRTSYNEFAKTGHWPDKTIFALEIYTSNGHGSIVKQGRYQDALVALEAAVKDESKPDTWQYYGFGTDRKTSTPNAKEQCWSCHSRNGAVENTFVQFYPTLLDVAYAKNTIKPTVQLTPTLNAMYTIIANQGWAKARSTFESAHQRDREADLFLEGNLNMLGYRLLGEHRAADAVGLFEATTQLYPNSANAQDSLADAYAAAGDRSKAAAAEKKAIALLDADTKLDMAQKKQLREAAENKLAEFTKNKS